MTLRAAMGTLGHQRASVGQEHDLYTDGSSIEVKHYDVENSRGRFNLVRSLGDQAALRGVNLPEGTTQRVLVDVRGQTAPPEVLDALAERIAKRSGGHVAVEDIVFHR